jgi:hexosaminidase
MTKTVEYPITVIPTPTKAEYGAGYFILTDHASVSAADETLSPLSGILTESVFALTGLRMPPALSGNRTFPICLAYDAVCKGEEYNLKIDTDSIRISGNTYLAVSHGVATFLQLIRFQENRIVLPCLTIRDFPEFPFRALMADLARQKHSLSTLKQLVVLCWWYKIHYLQLHLTDIQAFTFPSKTYPELASAHNSFSIEELRDLETFANTYGIVIIPELDLPGHANSMLRTLCPTEPHNDWNVINPVHRDTMKVLDTLIGEICDVFKSSPYFHIGGDEVVYKGWEDCRLIRQYMRENSIEQHGDLFNFFLNEVNKLVKQHGRRSIAWEGFRLNNKIKVANDVMVQCYEMLYSQPEDLLACGYEIINASWGPLYVVGRQNCSVEMIHQWNPCIFGSHSLHKAPHALENAPETQNITHVQTVYPAVIDFQDPPYVKAIPVQPGLFGAMLCSWGQPDCIELATLRRRIAAISERIWHGGQRRDFSIFLMALENKDEALELLLEDILARHTDVFKGISRSQEIAARLQAGQQVGIGEQTSEEMGNIALNFTE